MELFDLEIPIRTTGGARVRAEFKGLEQSATQSATAVERGQKRTESASLRATRAIMQQEAQQRANAQAAADAARAIETGMARIRSDVERASAAFKSGTISARDYKTALQFARVEAQQLAGTAGTLSGTTLRNLNAVIAGTTVATKGMGTGLATIRTGLASMAATAIGASGALGSMGAAMLTFASGTGTALAVVAAIGAIVLAYRALTARSREQKRITDELRESFKKLNDEMNRGPQAQRAAEQKAAASLRTRIADLETRLEQARQRPASADPEEQQARRAVIQRLENDIARARQELAASQAALDSFDATKGVEDAEKRRQALISLVAAGKASADQERELRGELAKTRAALAGLTPAYLRTADGVQRQAELTERAASIEAAFRRETTETTKAVEDRTAVLLALLQLEAPTAERWAELRTRADAITAALEAGNVPLAKRVELLRELAAIEAATGFGGLAPSLDFQPQRPPLRGITPPTQDATFTGAPDSLFEGDSISARLHRSIVESGKTAEEAAAIAAADFEAAGKSLAASFEQGLVGAFESLGRGGSFGQMIAGFAGQMLQALGHMAIKFGVAVSGIGALMEKAMKALASLNPIVAIAAGVALVALGSALQGAASSSFGGGSGGGGRAVSSQPVTNVFRVPSSNLVQAPARASANTGVMPQSPTPVNVTYFGKGRDPGFSRWLTEQVGSAQARGVRG